MSQIASAFAVPSNALPEAERYLNTGDWNGFWERMRPFAIDIAFPPSGYAVVVMVEYLRGLGIELPISSDSAVRQIVKRCGPLACTDRPGAAVTVAALAGVRVSDAILATYWRAFTGDSDSEGGAAMRAALDWLRQVFSAGQEGDWIVILEG
jgi:hypothetical protein